MLSHKDDSDEEIEPGFSLSSILFGNINKDGELIDGFLDSETLKHIKSLDRFNVASNLIDELKDDVKESIVNANNDIDNELEENFEKDDDAVDYSNENEVANDDEPVKNEEEDAKFREALSELVFKMPTAPISKITQPKKKHEDDDYDLPDEDKILSKNEKSQSFDEKLGAIKDSSNLSHSAPKQFCSVDPVLMEKSEKRKLEIVDSNNEPNKINKKRLDTPLAEMLPSKYEDCDVTEIFPEFRPNKTLRFSRLFGPGKTSIMPNLWKNVKNKKRKKRRQTSESGPMKDDSGNDRKESKELINDNQTIPQDKIATTNSSIIFDDYKNAENKSSSISKNSEEFSLMFAKQYDENDVEEDQEEFLKRPLEYKNYLDSDNDMNGDLQNKIAHWRSGPAAYWYSEMFDATKIFDFGFKKRNEHEQNESSSEECSEEIEDDLISNHSLEDCYHMVTQGQWEDEVIWNGEDVKQKILAKNTEKYHAAGWVPSGQNRTASSFIKQVRGLSLPSIGQPKSTSNSTSTINSTKKDNKSKSDQTSLENEKDETWYSMFPAENEELVYGIWENDVIWDAENLAKIPEPKILTLDPNDENIVLGIPDDIDPNAVKPKEVIPIPLKEKKEHHLKKSRILLGKAGVIAEPEPDSPPPPEEIQRDPYNISNDDYYNPKLANQTTALKPTVGINLIQHSIPALELRPIFFPTYMGLIKLRSFHRPPLKRYSHGAIADSLSHPVIPLLKHMKKKAKQREQERLAAGGGDMFFMRTPEDVSGKDGDLILCEYSEEHPPLMMQVGMATKIKNYYKRRLGKDVGAPDYEFGETVYAHTTPFLGNLAPGQSLQAIENNLFRAPIYKHNFPETDFLIIRTRNNYYIRNVDTIFTVGQELPLYEVPGPNSKKANNFIRDFLQVFIHRLFWSSTDVPKRIKMEDIKKAFPSHSESSIRKRLKICADFKRTGLDSNWWVLKPEFRLPTEEEMRALVSCEQCCSYYSMIAAEQRLKDAGYGEKTLFTAEDDNDEDQQGKMEDEVKTAPWNTTRAFIAATKGKCLLQLNGCADPTGCGEGFSYIRIPNKPQISKEDIVKQQEPKKTVTGTDADLRRLPLSAAKNLLRKHNVPEEEIKKLSRWEVIDVVRTLSTAQAKQGSEAVNKLTLQKFARGNRFSIAEHQERYKEEAQRLFELQNKCLASTEELSTDEDESEDEEDMDIEEMSKNIENIIANKKTSQQLSLEKEEEERRELRKLLMGEESNQSEDKTGTNLKKGIRKSHTTNTPNKQQQSLSNPSLEEENDDSMNMSNQGAEGKLLKIYRTYHNADGKEYIRIETVRKPAIITAYVKLRQTKDPEQIKKFTQALDEQEKEEYRKVKRRLQEQLRRLKRNAEKNQLLSKQQQKQQSQQQGREMKLSLSDEPVNDIGIGFNATYEDPSLSAKPIGSNGVGCSISGLNINDNGIKKSKEKKEKPEKKETKVRCGNCGQSGHMKTNKICPMYTGDLPPIPVAMTEQEEQEQKTSTMEREDLIKVDDTKLIFSKALFSYEEELRKKTLILKVPKDVLKRKRRILTDDYCDYLDKPDYKTANRRRKDPLVSLSIILEEIVNEIKQMEGTEPFWLPVNSKKVKDYYNIITKPMDIQTIRKKVSDKEYKARDEFLENWFQIHENSRLYNGPTHQLTNIANRMYELAKQRIEEKSDKIAILERSINPLLDNDQVAFSYILESIVLPRLRNVPDSWPFHKPVNKKNVKNYYDIIKNPIDLETMLANVKEHKYHSRQMFLNDVELMYNNCLKYNGAESPLTKKSLELVEIAKQCIEENDEKLKELENSILANKAALDGDDSESVVTGGLSNPEMDDYPDFDEENSQTVVGQQEESMEYQQMEIVDNEEIVYDNYDPSEFLRERFNQPVVMSEDEESRHFSVHSGEPMDRQEESNDKQINETSNFEQDFQVSESSNEMQIDNQDQSNQDEDDIWF